MAASVGTIPQTAMPTRGPACVMIQPTTGAPTGVPPVNASMYSPMTRPRTAGSTHICTDEFAIAWKARFPAPITTRRTRKNPSPGASAATAWLSPKTAVIMISNRSRTWPRLPAIRAPVTDPAATVTVNSP